MTYKEFVEKLKSRLQSELSYPQEAIKFYPEGFTSDDPEIFDWIISTNKKFSGEESPYLLKDFLVIEHEAGDLKRLMHRISLPDVYRKSEEDGFEEAFSEIMNSVEGIRSPAFDTKTISKRGEASYDDMKSQLIIRPLNYGLHMHELKGNVYDRVGDIALVLYQLIGNAERSLMTSKISREELERWGMSGRQDEVMKAALENTERIFPACVSLDDGGNGREIDVLTNEFTPKDITYDGLIVMSTLRHTNGALSLFYPSAGEKMRKVMGGSFLAVCMNTDDVLLFERNDSKAWNFTHAAKKGGNIGEMLSARVFLCDEKGVRPV